jgi:futalosine hydrolase
MKILLLSATQLEIAPTLDFLHKTFNAVQPGVYTRGHLVVELVTGGLGPSSTSWQLANALHRSQPDWCIQAGIAGSFDRDLALGAVVNVVSECWGDLGAEDQDGRLLSAFDLGLVAPDQFPYTQGLLLNPDAGMMHFLPAKKGLTVQKAHGSAASIEKVRQKFPEADLESMEGAAFFEGCLLSGRRFMQLRSISNYIEPRNREGWNLPLAITALNKTLVEVLDMFSN